MTLMTRLAAAAALAIAVLTLPVSGQDAAPIEWGHARAMQQRAQLAQLPRAKAPKSTRSVALMSAAERRQAIDAFWGPGEPTAVKLQIFDRFWEYADTKYAAFQGITVDWNALRERYRPEVAAGVSRGRFAAIINHMSLALRESHTQVVDMPVNYFVVPERGVPLLAVGAWGYDPSGACVTAMEDGSALVYAAIPNHPLGVQRGDRILGYDGRPWRELYQQLLAEEIPLWPLFWGSSPSSFEHSFVMAALQNWGLFDVIDIAKANGTVAHVPTSRMPGPIWVGFCSEQMNIPGVPKPTFDPPGPVSFGVVAGTRIGYIYVWDWITSNVPAAFAEAVRQLTQVQQVDGLILDFRTNFGGYLAGSTEGLGELFSHPMISVGIDGRRNDDHFAMQRLSAPGFYVLDFNLFTGERIHSAYDGPIGVLVGPGAVSSGDFGSYWASLHPNARTFGKPTAAAFNLPTQPALGTELNLHPDWFGRVAEGNLYPVGSPGEYLTHREFPVDEPVWLRPTDVAQGRDTVVNAALTWIQRQAQIR